MYTLIVTGPGSVVLHYADGSYSLRSGLTDSTVRAMSAFAAHVTVQ